MTARVVAEKDEPNTRISHHEIINTVNTEDQLANLPLKEAVRRYLRYTYYMVGLSTVIILWGYDLAVVGSITAVDAFLQDFGVLDSIEDGEEKWIIPAIWLSAWQAFPCIGQLCGAISAGPLQDRFGRRPILFIGSIIILFSVLVEVLAYKAPTLDSKRGVFLAGKMIQGYATALIKVSVPLQRSLVEANELCRRYKILPMSLRQLQSAYEELRWQCFQLSIF